MDRAYSLLHIKAVDQARRLITGIASTPEPDRHGDIIEPTGVTFRNPVPLLLHHDKSRPVGWVTFQEPTAEGIRFEAELPLIDERGIVKDRIDEAWHSIKAGLLAGISIGFRVVGDVRKNIQKLATGGFRFLETEIFELSLVTIPANAHARIDTIKSLDASDLAALGLDPSGAPELPSVRVKGAAPMRTIPEQIATWEATRTERAARMAAIMNAAGEVGATLDADQTKEYDAIAAEVANLDGHLERLKALERSSVHTATRIVSPAVHSVSVKPNVEKGSAFTRYAMALAYGNGDMMRTLEYAKQWKDSTPEVELLLKAAVAAGNTTDATWAAPLVSSPAAAEFLELLRPATILGNIRNLRNVPFNTRVPAQTAGGAYGWVGEGRPKPVTKLAFAPVTLGISKAAGIIVITEELARSSTPSAEALIRADMIAGISQFLDQQFTDPAVAEVANVSPASITNGITPITATTDARADILSLITAFVASGLSTSRATFLMSEVNALMLGVSQNPLGQPEFPGLGATGGTVYGIPVVTSQALGDLVILMDGPNILLADDGGVSIDVSREASVQMDSAPAYPSDATTVLVSLWQMNLVGLRAERFANWKRARTEAVQYLNAGTWVLPAGMAAAAAAAAAAKAPNKTSR